MDTKVNHNGMRFLRIRYRHTWCTRASLRGVGHLINAYDTSELTEWGGRRPAFSDDEHGDLVGSSQINAVRSIRERRIENGQTQYRVHWAPKWITFTDQRAARRLARDVETSLSRDEEYTAEFRQRVAATFNAHRGQLIVCSVLLVR
jgi:hypothetical protein